MLRRLTWRQATVGGILILVFIAVVGYLHRDGIKHQVGQSPAQPGVRSGVQGTSVVRRLPESAPFDVLRPRYPVDDTVGYPAVPRPVAGASVRAAEVSGPMFPPDVPEDGVIRLDVPPTKVHPLADAAAVMGLDPATAAEVGVSHTRALPPEARPVILKTDAMPVSAPLNSAATAIGAPPGVSPDDVGKTKTQPVPSDRKPH